MKEIRYLDKLVDELAKGKALQRVLRDEKSPDNTLLFLEHSP